ATFKKTGTQSLTATDTAKASITGTQSGIQVQSARATTLAVTNSTTSSTASPTTLSSTAGSATTFTVAAQDPYGNDASDYTGTVHFAATDGKVTLPDYTFGAADGGEHTFTAAF